jgi:hypothetical protein
LYYYIHFIAEKLKKKNGKTYGIITQEMSIIQGEFQVDQKLKIKIKNMHMPLYQDFYNQLSKNESKYF